MERYSPTMLAGLKQELAGFDEQALLLMLQSFKFRGGPGLVLVETECIRRGMPITETTNSSLNPSR